MPKVYSRDPVVNDSLRHSIRDGVAYSVMSGGGETYFSAFAIHLRATAPQIGLLASLPPLLGSFAQLLSAWLGHFTRQRKAIILAGVSVQAFSWLPIALLPLVFPDYSVPLLIAAVVVYYAGGNFATPQWSSLMGDLVPERRRGRYFAFRTRLSTATAFTALVACGVLLHLFDDKGQAYLGFLVVFAIAATGRLMSIYHLAKMHDPPGQLAVVEAPWGHGWWARLRGSAFVRFSLFVALLQFSVAIASPFFTLYMLRDLQFTYLEFTANTAASVLVQFLTLAMWGRISDVFGNRLILATTGSFIPLLPGLWILSTDFWYLLAVQALSGLVWAGFSLSAGNFLYDLIPAGKRAPFMALHNVMTSVGVFLGALLGGFLGAVLPVEASLAGLSFSWLSPLYGVFLVSTLARLLVAAIFLPKLREVRSVRPMSVGGLIFRITRFNALSGLFFDVVGVRRRNAHRGAVSKNGHDIPKKRPIR